ncbi:MAG: sulfatase-like hydrolase/transferase [Planctomycetales bacterium]
MKKTGVEENTLVIFLSDNGASDVSVKPLLDKPGETWRLDGKPTLVGNIPEHEPGSEATFMSAGAGWASVSNTPFRGHKNGNYEGGIATPCIVRWPAVIRDKGKTSSALGHIADLTATCLDVAGVAYPIEFAGRKVQPMYGQSLFPILRGEKCEGHAHLCWGTSGSKAIREGNWKLVAGKDGPWELFDLSTDRGETQDLARKFPEHVQRMEQRYLEWVKTGQ